MARLWVEEKRAMDEAAARAKVAAAERKKAKTNRPRKPKRGAK